ncbi:Hypothetical_protein [Hexamita inflata]|uniref:Hypothetical_protein n=1 Tax=Hexamita inflata TaxID=28002 RepID=A0AA86NYA3_9EUKA|nr:Hypothetical protein HINF_LOCUS15203 [Hexamita inflata]
MITSFKFTQKLHRASFLNQNQSKHQRKPYKRLYHNKQRKLNRKFHLKINFFTQSFQLVRSTQQQSQRCFKKSYKKFRRFSETVSRKRNIVKAKRRMPINENCMDTSIDS